jgi:hypothetical protein
LFDAAFIQVCQYAEGKRQPRPWLSSIRLGATALQAGYLDINSDTDTDTDTDSELLADSELLTKFPGIDPGEYPTITQ